MNKFKPQHEMTSSPDKQFREGLEHYKKSPPPQAWNRVESGLHKNKNRSVWYSAAAAVVLLIGATFMLFRSNENQIANPTITLEQNSNTEISNPQSLSTVINEPIAEQIESAPVIQQIAPKAKASNKEIPTLKIESYPVVVASNEITTEASAPQTATPEVISTTSQEPVAINDVASSSTRSNKIIYSSGEVNSRFLKKPTDAPVPVKEKTTETTPEKPQTPIQKIIDIASNLKYEENALGELREKKNEILSLPRRDAKNKWWIKFDYEKYNYSHPLFLHAITDHRTG